MAGSIEDIVMQYGSRGMNTLYPFLPKESYRKAAAAYYLQRSSKAIGRPVGYRGDQQMIRFDNAGTKGKVTADFL